MWNRQFKIQKQQKKKQNEFLELATKFNEVDTAATEQKNRIILTN